MLIYFLILSFCLLLSFLKIKRTIENIALITIAFVICFGYTTGTDWQTYERFYYGLISNLDGKEYGYILLQTIFHKLGVNFWIFHIGIKLIVFYLLIEFVRLFNINIFLFLVFFLPDAGFYLFIDCPFRNLIAIGISLLAIKKIIEKKHLQYFMLILLAMTFHITSIVMILAFFMMKVRLKPIIQFILVLLSAAFAFQTEFLLSNILSPLSEISTFVADRLLFYLSDQKYFSDSINVGFIFRLFAFSLFLIYRDRIIALVGEKYFILNLAFLFMLLYPWGVSIKIFQRFCLFLFPFLILSILYLIKSLKRKWNVYFIYFIFLLFSFFQTYKILTVDHRYVPYTHYLFYPKNDRTNSIEFRSQYNILHSPYPNKQNSK